MNNLSQRREQHKQVSIWLVAVLLVMAAAFFKGAVKVHAEEATLIRKYSYIDNNKDVTELRNTKAGQKYKLGIKVKSTSSNPKLKYEWYLWKDSEQEKRLSYTTAEITITKSKCRKEYYVVEVTDEKGNSVMGTFDLYREDILKTKLYVNGTRYDEGKIVAVDSEKKPVLKVETATSQQNTTYSWQRKYGSEETLGSQSSYEADRVTETEECYICNVESDGYKESYVFQIGIESVKSMNPTIEMYVNGTKTELLKGKLFDAYAKKGDTVKLVTKITTTKYTPDQISYKWYDQNGELLTDTTESSDTYTFTKSGENEEQYQCRIALKSDPDEENSVSICIALDSGIRGISYINGVKTDTGEVTVKSYDDLKNIKFKVEATGDNPIKSYQWYMLDKMEDDTFLADGQEYTLPKEIAQNEDFVGIGCKVTDTEESSGWFYFFVNLDEDDDLPKPDEVKKPTPIKGDNKDLHAKVNKALKTGTRITDKKTKAVYKVTGKNTVEYTKPSTKNIKTLTIPSTITINKTKYQVTSIAAKAMKNNSKLKKLIIPASIKKIGAQAFCGCKNLKTIIVKTAALTQKTVGTKAFKGINAKAVIKVPKKQLKAYQKLLKARGTGKKVKIKK